MTVGVNVTWAVAVIFLVLLSAFSGMRVVIALFGACNFYLTPSVLGIYKYCNITIVCFIYVLRYFQNFTFYLFVDVATIELINIFVCEDCPFSFFHFFLAR